MNTVALRNLASAFGEELGPTFEGRSLVSWLVTSAHPECARVSLPNEAVLLCELLLIKGVIAPVGNGSGNVGSAPEFFFHERRAYAVAGSVAGLGKGGGALRRASSWLATTGAGAPGVGVEAVVRGRSSSNGSVGSAAADSLVGAGAPFDPAELLQLPPSDLKAMLEELVVDLQRSLKPLPAKLSDPAAATSGDNSGSSSESAEASEYAGEALVTWLVATRRAASASHGMLLGNLLVHAGLLAPTPSSLKQQSAWENFNARQQSSSSQQSMGGAAGRPFSDAPVQARSAAAAQAAAAEASAFRVSSGLGGSGNNSSSHGNSSSRSSSKGPQGGEAPDALYFASNPRLALLRFTVAAPAGADGWADGAFGDSRSSGRYSGGSGALAARAAEDGEREMKALTAAVAAEEAALVADKETLARDVLCLKELEGGVRSDVSALTHEQGQVNGPLLNELHRVQFLVEARQIKLLSELQAIYPIHPLDSSATSSHGGGSGVGNRDSVSAAGWCIRNLELPRDLTALEDEHVSSALGYVVHLVALLSKYLQLPLRYQLVYAGSRSAVRDQVSAHGGAHPSAGGMYGSSGSSGNSSSGGGLGLSNLVGGGSSSSSGGSDGNSSGHSNSSAALSALGGALVAGGLPADGLQLYPLYRRGADPARFERGCQMLAANVEQLLFCRGVRSDASLRLTRRNGLRRNGSTNMGSPGNRGSDDGGAHVLGALGKPVNGAEILKNLEALFRAEICPQLA